MCFTTFQYPPGACSFSSENTVSVVMCRSLSWCRNVYDKYADMVMMKTRVWCMPENDDYMLFYLLTALRNVGIRYLYKWYGNG